MMSRIFKGTSDDLAYYETNGQGYRAVYESNELAGLTLPKREITSHPLKIDLIRGYKFQGQSWQPHNITNEQRKLWRNDIRAILGEDDK